MEAAVQTVVAEITKPVVKSIGQGLGYLLRPSKYVNKLNLLLQPLRKKHKILEDAVVEAKGLGKPIKPEVELWLQSAGEIIAQAEELLKESTDTTQRCFHGWCVDFGSRYKINKSAVQISEERIPALAPAPDSTSVERPPPPPTVVSDSGFMEFESTKETMRQIMEALRDAECGVVGIFGMGGIGKTTIVKKIAEKVKQEKQFDQVAMAVVSQSSDLKKIQGQIAFMLGLKLDPEADVLGRASQLHQRLKNLKSILVILDDVWEKLELTQIGIPDFANHKGCKVMLTTRRKDVCTSMGTGNEKKIEVGVLSEQESWELFKSSAGDSIEAPPKLKEAALAVMKECQGLPVALKTVGSALRGKDINDWEAAKLQLRKAIYANIEGLTKGIISCLRLSYDYLQSPDMKACFLICCLFPEDYNIPHEILVRYATGKGLFLYADTIDEARTHVETTLRNLKASSLLLEGDKAHCAKVHDVVRDVGLSIASEAKLLSRSGPGLGRWLQRYSMEHIKGVCFAFAAEDAYSPVEGVQCPELEDLCLLATEIVSYSDAFFETMKKLKVLIHHGPSQMPTSLNCLVSLRTLHLVNCQLADMSALGELKKLEILTLHGSDIESLPAEVGQMTNLRLLDLMRNRRLRSIPSNVISQLTHLEELYIGDSFSGWEIEGTSSDTGDDTERGGRASLSELQSLPFLVILSIQVREFVQIPPNFRLQKELVKFDIGVGTSSDMGDYPSRLRALKLVGAEFEVEGVKSLLHLVDGNGCGRCQLAAAEEDGNGSKYVLTELAGGGGLNGLDRLEIRYNSWILALTSCDDKAVQPVLFGNLQQLRLYKVRSLRGLGSGGVLPCGSLQQLKVLDICGCDALEGWAVPWSWTHRLRHLEEVTIRKCENVTGVFEVKEEEEENNTNASSSSTLGPLSNLRELILDSLGSLRELGSGGVLPAGSLQQLKVLVIDDCDALEGWAVPWSWTHRLRHLEEVTIRKCENVTGVFEVKEEDEEENNTNASSSSTLGPLSNLRKLSLYNLGSLRELGSGGVLPAGSLQQLKVLEIHDCHALEGWAVPWSWTHRLRHLDRVLIFECKKVTGVFEVKEEEEENNTNASSSSTLGPLSNLRELILDSLGSLRELGSGGVLPAGSLQQLKVLVIDDCDALEGWAVPWSWTHRLRHLEELTIRSCENVTGVFEVKEEEEENNTNASSSSTLGPLSNLRELILDSLGSLRELGSGGVLPAGSLQQLKVLEIHDCHALEGWAVPWSWTHRLRHLEELTIRSCENVTGVFEVKEEEEENNTNASSSSTLGPLSNLRVIQLIGLRSLRGLGSGGVLPRGSLQQLKVLIIHYCHALEGWAVPWSWTHRLRHLEEVTILSCENVTGVFEVKEEEEENNTNASSSSTLGPLSNLRDLSIIDCDSLVYVFARNVVSQSLVHLETLTIYNCSNLEAIFEETTTSIALPNLKTVIVYHCNQLKSLFTVSMAKGLLKLETLVLRDNSQLEEIVSCDQNRASGAEAEDEKKKENNDNAQSSSSIISITWPKIRSIDLNDSRQLKRFFPENCYIEMALLQEFKHAGFDSDCLKNFGADPPASANIINTEETSDSEEDEDNSEEEEDEVNSEEEEDCSQQDNPSISKNILLPPVFSKSYY